MVKTFGKFGHDPSLFLKPSRREFLQQIPCKKQKQWSISARKHSRNDWKS